MRRLEEKRDFRSGFCIRELESDNVYLQYNTSFIYIVHKLNQEINNTNEASINRE